MADPPARHRGGCSTFGRVLLVLVPQDRRSEFADDGCAVVLLTGLRPEAYAPQVSAKMAATPPVLEWRTLLRPPWIREDNMFGRGMTISDLISGIIISTVLGLVITVITVLGKLVKRHLGYRRYKQAGNKISYRDYKKLGDDERASGQSW